MLKIYRAIPAFVFSLIIMLLCACGGIPEVGEPSPVPTVIPTQTSTAAELAAAEIDQFMQE